MKHTNGPLFQGFYVPSERFKGICEFVAVMDGQGRLIATTGPSDDANREQSIADAKLFATAQELLLTAAVLDEVCSAMLDPEHTAHGRVNWADIQAAVRATLAKARGESEAQP